MEGEANLDIREIETIIDNHHKGHAFLSGSKLQLSYELLTSFEDLCLCTALASMLNPFALRQITDHMDSLNQALNWVENSELPVSEGQIELNISEERYNQCISFLTEYAYPYSIICSGYISFSRKRLSADIDGNTVTFTFPNDENKTAWNDILREVPNTGVGEFFESFNPIRIMDANAKLQKKVFIEDEKLCYELSSEILDPFLEVAEGQWNATKTLPDHWKFDKFTLSEYKKVWGAITALCYIHFFGCTSIKDPQIRLKNALIIQSIDNIVDYVSSISGIENDIVRRIVDYLLFEPSKRNVDIMYQPLIIINSDTLLIAPMLFIGSRAERNLLAVVSSKKDFEHSKEVNDLEDLMVSEIEELISKNEDIKIAKHKNLGGRLPDIDLGIMDTTTNSVLLCELKWFMAADSTKEVYAREDEITHGCEQSEQIMAYAMSDRAHFIKRVFDVDDGENTDLFCCVVAKHNIRTQNKYVPVINIEKLKALLTSQPINSVFHTIRNHEYEEQLPDNSEITFRCVEYGGFLFKIPAIAFGSMPE